MMEKLLIATLGLSMLMIGWAMVQRFWGQSFPDQSDDKDVLAGRTDCGNCGCLTSCKKNFSETRN